MIIHSIILAFFFSLSAVSLLEAGESGGVRGFSGISSLKSNAAALRQRLESQQGKLKERVAKEIPESQSSLMLGFDLAVEDLRQTKQDSTRAVIQDEIRKNAHRQIALDVIQRQAEDGILRIRSMVRQLQMDESMPEGVFRDFDGLLGYVTSLANDELNSRLDAVEVDEAAIAEKIRELEVGHKERKERRMVEQIAEERRQREEKIVSEKWFRYVKIGGIVLLSIAVIVAAIYRFGKNVDS